MNAKGISLLFYIFFSCCTLANSQNKDKNLIANYNLWLKTTQLSKLLESSEIGLDSTGNLVLTLTPSSHIKDTQDLAVNWKYVKSGLSSKGISIYDLLWFKWVAYAELPPEKLRIVIQTKDPSVFSLQLSFDGTLKISENSIEIRGGEISINYDFDEASGVPLNNVYLLKKPLKDLNLYYKQIEVMFKRSKHLAKIPIKVLKHSNSREILQLEILGMYGEATKKNYHEKVVITLILNSLAKPQTIAYWGTVWCAGGILNPSEFIDASNEPGLRENLGMYNQSLNTLFKSLFHEKI